MLRVLPWVLLAIATASSFAQALPTFGGTYAAIMILKADLSQYVPWQVGGSDAPPVTIANTPNVTAAPAAIAALPSSAAEASHVFKASAGSLYSLTVTPGIVSGYLLVFDAASVPADGAVSPKYCFTVPSSASYPVAWLAPVAMATGISVAFSTTGCTTKTTSPLVFFTAQVL